MCGDPYITYIEQKYIDKCKNSGNGANILSDWESKKLLYREMTKTTVYEFMNYSMHDESHSINILENIEMILGRNRVDKLSRSDLWLMLNVAYAHDIGMVAQYRDLESLWSDEEFKKYIKKSQNSLNRDDAKAAKLYIFLDKLLKRTQGMEYHDEEEQSFTFDAYDSWPLEFRKDITLLMTNFIRTNHGELSKQYFEHPEETNNYIICDRLYRLIGIISACHTTEHKDLESLPYHCKGFGTDKMHPRFVAMLLRLGDLLDLDNNRFDIFSLKHFGPLPEISVLNFKKHKSIIHFHIDSKVIEVTAQSNDFRVCKLNQSWFQYLYKDITYLITHWSHIAPAKLKGCLLGLPKLEVLHGKFRFEDNSNKGFLLEKQKLLELFTGNNLYNSDLDFIREYIQNAFDASKLQLSYELEMGEKESNRNDFYSNRELYLYNEDTELSNIKPFDLKMTAFNAFPITITLKPDNQNDDGFVMQIIDRGIGIDKEGLEAIINVGAGWKKRENHRKIMAKMREWLSPTGGFGIGLQSAFLVTNEVRIYTKAAFEAGYRITISNSDEKNVLVETDNGNLHQGTTAEFRIKFSAFDKPAIIKTYLKTLDETKNLFAIDNRMTVIRDIVKKYIEITFPSALFPIKLIVDDGSAYGRKKESIVSKYLYSEDSNGNFKVPSYINYKDNSHRIKNEFYNMANKYNFDLKNLYINLEKYTLRVWDDKAQVFYYFSPPDTLNIDTINVQANYKNVLVSDDTNVVNLKGTKHPEFVETLYDVMGVTVEDCLIVSRNMFRKDIAPEQSHIFLNEFTKIYAHLLLCMDKISIQTRIIIYACLIESNLDTVKKALETYASNLEMEILECWQVKMKTASSSQNKKDEKTEKKQILDIGLFSAKGLIESKVLITDDMKENLIWMAEVSNPDEKIAKYEFLCLPADDSVKIIGSKNSQQINSSIRIIQDKKFYAVLNRYQTIEKEVFFNFCAIGGFVKQPMKGYIINVNKKECKELMENLLKEEEPQKECSNDDYRMQERYWVVEVLDDNSLAPLVVNKIPFKNVIPNVYYIISPYPDSIGMQLGRTGLSIRQRIKLIEKEPSYTKLCQWVYDNQKDSKTYAIWQIKEAYREMVKRDFIYQRKEENDCRT